MLISKKTLPPYSQCCCLLNKTIKSPSIKAAVCAYSRKAESVDSLRESLSDQCDGSQERHAALGNVSGSRVRLNMLSRRSSGSSSITRMKDPILSPYATIDTTSIRLTRRHTNKFPPFQVPSTRCRSMQPASNLPVTQFPDDLEFHPDLYSMPPPPPRRSTQLGSDIVMNEDSNDQILQSSSRTTTRLAGSNSTNSQ